MAPVGLAVAASAWGVLMGISPVLQIRRMLREHSSREVSLGYFAVLLIGFVLWIAYGIAAGDPALIIPNSVALVVGALLMIIAVRLRPRPGSQAQPRPAAPDIVLAGGSRREHGHVRAAAAAGEPGGDDEIRHGGEQDNGHRVRGGGAVGGVGLVCPELGD